MESDRWGPSSSNRSWFRGKLPRYEIIPAWEKKFVLANRICWRKLVETKEFLHQYPDITGWDDSAGKEAFENAKARFSAEMNRLQPKTPLPDPDLFIDHVDHDTPPSDTKLYDEEADDNDDRKLDEWGDGGVILWDSHYIKNEEEEEEEVVIGWGDTPTGWAHTCLEKSYKEIIPTGWF